MNARNPVLTLLIAATATLTSANAAVISYRIIGEVTDIPNAPGSFDVNRWDFSAGTTFEGSFMADDTVPGGFVDFSLVIGGVDGASTHTLSGGALFSPTALTLYWIGSDPSGVKSAVKIGTRDGSNRIPAIEGTSPNVTGPLEPGGVSPLNWIGTYQIETTGTPGIDRGTEPASVPDAGSLALTALLGLGERSGTAPHPPRRVSYRRPPPPGSRAAPLGLEGGGESLATSWLWILVPVLCPKNAAGRHGRTIPQRKAPGLIPGGSMGF